MISSMTLPLAHFITFKFFLKNKKKVAFMLSSSYLIGVLGKHTSI